MEKLGKKVIIETLQMTPHQEGGYFAETYRSAEKVDTSRRGRTRSLSTCMYYLLTNDSPTGWLHKNRSDIVHYFHGGSAIEYTLLSPEGKLTREILGGEIQRGQKLQMVVPGGYWKGSRLTGGEYGLLSESVAPGFEYEDCEMATEAMKGMFPAVWEEIKGMVRG